MSKDVLLWKLVLVVLVLFILDSYEARIDCSIGGVGIFNIVKEHVYQISRINRMFFNKGYDTHDGDNLAHQQFMANGDNDLQEGVANDGFGVVDYTRKLIYTGQGDSVEDLKQDEDIRELVKTLFDICNEEPPSCSGQTNAYRSFDGTCNNLNNSLWGAAGQPQVRLLTPDYSDRVGKPRRARDGSRLPNPRALSNALHSDKAGEILDDQTSVMLMQFGQFLDHDLSKTPLIPGTNASAIDCCATEREARRPEVCFPFPISRYDKYFRNSSMKCMNFVRSAPAHICPPTYREQINLITAFIDASNVYGSGNQEVDDLRLFEKGLLKTVMPGDYLPPTEAHRCIVEKEHKGAYCLNAGDKRTNVNPSLQAIHTIFHRAHNIIAMKLAEVNPHWKDERLFQEARKIMIAIMQHIVYKEFLPCIIGDEMMELYELNEVEAGFDDVYDPSVNAGIINAFAAAAFRYGHSEINHYQFGLYKNRTIDWKLPLYETFHRPFYSRWRTGVDGLIRWLVFGPSAKSDQYFSDSVRNNLFKNKENRLDLPALNVQRGRDHGLPGYNLWRRLFGLLEFDSDRGRLCTADHTDRVADMLKYFYRRDSDIDLFTAGMTEIPIAGARVGPLFAHIIASQFRRLKKGDRYYYENPDPNPRVGFTEDQVNEIKKMSLAKIICETIDIDEIQPKAFKLPNSSDNPLTPCADHPAIDYSKWQV